MNYEDEDITYSSEEILAALHELSEMGINTMQILFDYEFHEDCAVEVTYTSLAVDSRTSSYDVQILTESARTFGIWLLRNGDAYRLNGDASVFEFIFDSKNQMLEYLFHDRWGQIRESKVGEWALYDECLLRLLQSQHPFDTDGLSQASFFRDIRPDWTDHIDCNFQYALSAELSPDDETLRYWLSGMYEGKRRDTGMRFRHDLSDRLENFCWSLDKMAGPPVPNPTETIIHGRIKIDYRTQSLAFFRTYVATKSAVFRSGFVGFDDYAHMAASA